MTTHVRVLLLAFLPAALGLLGAQQAGVSGSVSVSYTFSRLYPVASNQYAIWIETSAGSFVRTLLVTDFTGKRAGWRYRPQSLPRWVKAAGAADLEQVEVDAVSAPTQGSGPHRVAWDLKDSTGKPVPPGTYRFLAEGAILWDREVLWEGTITVGYGPEVSRATATFVPPGAQGLGTLLSEVSASYVP